MPKLTESTLAILDAQIQTGAFCGPALLNELLRGYRAHVREPTEADIAAICRAMCCPEGCVAREGNEVCGRDGFAEDEVDKARDVIRAWRGRE